MDAPLATSGRCHVFFALGFGDGGVVGTCSDIVLSIGRVQVSRMFANGSPHLLSVVPEQQLSI